MDSERGSLMYKVAICDDNPADLQLITDYLTEPEFHYPLELSSFHDGVELAQAYKKEGQFDLIILDMMMDRLNGIETALKIRKVDQNVAILIVTATVEYAIEGYKINAAHLFPFRTEKLSPTTSMVLRKSGRVDSRRFLGVRAKVLREGSRFSFETLKCCSFLCHLKPIPYSPIKPSSQS